LEKSIWNEKLEQEDIKLLEDVNVMADNLISQVYIFIDLFHQYIDLIQSAAMFTPQYGQPKVNDANVYPTQTAAETSNRADRRAREKKKTPFDVVQGQK
jgi:deoxyadenosine/deoxycytidine kinase